MGQHFVVDELVPLGGLDDAVQRHDAAKGRVVKDHQVLVVGPAFKQHGADLEGLGPALVQRFTKREVVHGPCSCAMNGGKPTRRTEELAGRAQRAALYTGFEGNDKRLFDPAGALPQNTRSPRGRSLMVKHLVPNQTTWVRFPSPAPLRLAESCEPALPEAFCRRAHPERAARP